MQVAKRSTDFIVAFFRGGSGLHRAQISFHFLNHKTQLKLQTERGTLFLSLAEMEQWGLLVLLFFFLFCSRNYRFVYFSSLALIVAFQVLSQFASCGSIFCLNFLDLFCSFFLWFSVVFLSFHHFFFFFYNFLRLSHLLWSFECGIFFSILFL